MAQRCFKQLTSGDRVMISKLRAKRPSLSEIARPVRSVGDVPGSYPVKIW